MSSGSLSDIEDIVHMPSDENHNTDKVIATDFIGNTLTKQDSVRSDGKVSGFRVDAEDGEVSRPFEFTFRGDVNTQSINIYVPSGDGRDHDNVNKINEISIYINSNRINYPVKEYDKLPKTQRIVGISGCLVPPSFDATLVPVMGKREVVLPAVPEQRFVIEETRPISTSSLKYCPTDECREIFTNRDPTSVIADGPVVAAQEIYFQKPFDVGVKRSRITVLTDASMIQGRRIADEGGVIDDNIISFLQSLYPTTFFPGQRDEVLEDDDFDMEYKIYDVATKITAPVKGSPQKFFNSTGNSGQMIRFAGDGTPATSGRAMSFFSDDIDPNTFDNNGNLKSPLPIEIGKGAEKLLPKDPPYPDHDQVQQNEIKRN